MDFYIERYKGIEEKTYACEVVTPLFMSGADQSKVEIRASAVKGLIRFWWRAHFQGSLKEMKEREADIFGSTEQSSKLDVTLLLKSDLIGKRDLPNSEILLKNGKRRGEILKFLEYGAHTRDHIPPGVEFDLNLKFNRRHKFEIEQAVSAFLAVGNLGSKSRNGFGSIYYEGNVSYKLPKFENPPKEYISMSIGTTQYITRESYKSWNNALEIIGMAYGDSRFSLNDSKNCEKRALLAKPINQAKIRGRLSKPLFLHVRKEGHNKFRGQITVFPTLPENKTDTGKYNQMMTAFLENLSRNPDLQEVD